MSDAPSDTPNTPRAHGDPLAPATPAASAAASAPAPHPPAREAGTPAAAPGGPRLVTVNSVNWGSVLDFTQLFRGFRLAINPAKLAMALLAILVIYSAGRLFDAVWGSQASDQEIEQFTSEPPRDFSQQRALTLKARDDYFHAASYDERKTKFKKEFDDAVEAAHQTRLKAGAPAAGMPSPDDAEQAARKFAADDLQRKMEQLNSMRGHGIFETFFKYEIGQFNHLVDNTLALVHLNTAVPATAMPQALWPGNPGGGLAESPNQPWNSNTIIGSIANLVLTGPRWLVTGAAPMQWRPDNADTTMGWIHMLSYRALYLASLLALGVLCLVMIALAGAAISRLSALELAGIERAPLKDVFFFAVGRLWTFIKAPVAPFLILLAIGLLMALVSLLGAIPYAGPVLIGLIFFAFLGVSFVLMLLLLGIIGGFNLLYPAIAVEGADSFDAMSRSFAYAYARPWRLGFYTLTSLIYGVITLLFVSFAVFLILFLSHTFVGWGMNLAGIHYGAQSGVTALDTLWPEPHFLRLITAPNWYVMNWAEFIGSLLLHFWVYLLVSGIGAFVISYYFSSHTIIYLLLRRSVDGQNLKEVHLEEKAK